MTIDFASLIRDIDIASISMLKSLLAASSIWSLSLFSRNPQSSMN